MLPNNIRFKPLYERLTIKSCTHHGKLGLFAQLPIKEGEVLGISHLRNLRSDNMDEFMDGWLRTPLGGFYHHSSDPNCLLVPYPLNNSDKTELYQIITDTPIDVGDEITCGLTI